MVRGLLAVFVAIVPLAASVAVTPATAAVTPSPDSRPHDGGVVEGRIGAVDFQRDVMVLDTANRGRLEMMLMPSTSIQSKDSGYHAITDLKVGAHVEVFSSIVGGKYVAQIIRIL